MVYFSFPFHKHIPSLTVHSLWVDLFPKINKCCLEFKVSVFMWCHQSGPLIFRLLPPSYYLSEWFHIILRFTQYLKKWDPLNCSEMNTDGTLMMFIFTQLIVCAERFSTWRRLCGSASLRMHRTRLRKSPTICLQCFLELMVVCFTTKKRDRAGCG